MVKPELDSTKDYYSVLGISTSSTQVDIRKAYLDLARTQHPDKNPGHEAVFKAKFQHITTAYDVLKDPVTKRTYDQIRPIVRKEFPRFTAASVPKFATHNGSGTRATPASAARPSAFPRQAKNAAKAATPKSSPKKAPTARKDPLSGWTPPIPQSKTTKDFTSPKPKPASHTYYSDSPSSKGPNASKAHTPSAARSAFYNASPSSPYNVYNNKSRSTDVPMPHKTGKTNPTSQPDWNAKENIWAKSNTAYSTFHGPASRYSPYAPDKSDIFSTPSTPQTNTTRENVFSSRRVKTPTPPSARFATGCGIFSAGGKKSATEYEWQNSRSAYQRQGTPAKGTEQLHKAPRQNHFGADTKTGNPFLDAQSRATSLDSDIIDDFSDEDDQRADRGSKGESNASRSSSEDKSRASRVESPEVSAPDNKRDEPKGSIPRAESGRSTFSNAQEFTSNLKHNYKPFSFEFKPPSPAQMRTNSSRRTSAGVPPYVKFNPIPDLNFSSPAQPDSGESDSSPFSSNTKTPSSGETSAQHDFAKKHARIDEPLDPRYSSGTPGEDNSDDLSVKFSSFGINKSSPPIKTPLRDELKSEKSRSRRMSKSSASSPNFAAASTDQGNFTFNSPSPLKPTLSSDSNSPPVTGKWSNDFINNAPSPAVELLRPFELEGVSKDRLMESYISCRKLFSSYLTGWSLYETLIVDDDPRLSITSPTYLAALSKHQRVLRLQADRIEQFIAHIGQQQTSTKEQTTNAFASPISS